jgi:putative membrane protein
MQLLLRWVINAAALFATVWILQQFGLATVAAAHWSAWFIAVIIMAFVNALIRPVARFLTAPLNCLTFGIMGVVVNAVMFWLVAAIAQAAGAPVFTVTPVGALIGAILVGMISGLLSSFLIRDDEKERGRDSRR